MPLKRYFWEGAKAFLSFKSGDLPLYQNKNKFSEGE
jgi:hypothetical protein